MKGTKNLSTFKFHIGTETLTFQAEENDKSIHKILTDKYPDCTLIFYREDQDDDEDSGESQYPYDGHFIIMDRWEFSDPQRPWEGENKHYFSELLIEQHDKKGNKSFVPYYDNPYYKK